VNASNGAPLWHYQAAKYVSQVQVADGVVYTNTAAEGNSAALSALRATDGSQLWRYTLATGSPALLGISDGTVYAIQGIGDIGSPNYAQSIYALRASDAHVLWHTPIARTDGLVSRSMAEANGIVYISTIHGTIYALHADTGVQLWHVAQTSSNGRDFGPGINVPMLENGLVYVGNSQGVSAFRASDGVRVWQYKDNIENPFGALPTVSNGVVYFGNSHGFIVALRATDGTQLWQRSEGGGFSRLLSVTDGLVINDAGPVYALRASDGAQLWQRPIQGSGEGSDAGLPEVVGEGIVFIGGDDGSVQALQASDGKILWRYMIKEKAVPTEPVYSASVTFANSVSYQQALEIVTNLGLELASMCPISLSIAEATRKAFPTYHYMTVAATVNSAPLWLDRLAATPGIEQAQPIGAHSCPNMNADTLPKSLPSNQINTFVRVTFADAVQYATALDATIALGFRLPDPCYEQVRAQDMKPMWHPMAQVDSFGKTHTLLLATTFLNAINWQNQLKAVTGVVKLEAPYKASC
ncbi:MAG: PQQ-binding-like beta-propeller repeat protein, partial [Chloroflexota bacterium]|nr:PQQ-binding-like beta-propeller repeat protein [Chloroflexota bacterium]